MYLAKTMRCLVNNDAGPNGVYTASERFWLNQVEPEILKAVHKKRMQVKLRYEDFLISQSELNSAIKTAKTVLGYTVTNEVIDCEQYLVISWGDA